LGLSLFSGTRGIAAFCDWQPDFFLRDLPQVHKIFRARLFSPGPLLVLILINAISWAISKRFFEGTYYLSLVISSILVFKLASGAQWRWVSKKTDKFIGDMSYPIYLLHWQTGLLVSYTLFGRPIHGVSVDGLVNVSLSLLLVLVISMAFVRVVDRPVQKLRARVRSNNLRREIGFPPTSVA